MQRPLRPVNWAPPVLNWPGEAPAAKYSHVRAFPVPNRISFTPFADSEGNWTVGSPKSVLAYSAVGYFFRRAFYKDLHVPVGLIFSYWGRLVAEAWTSADALKAMPDFETKLDQVQNAAAGRTDLKIRKSIVILPSHPSARTRVQ